MSSFFRFFALLAALLTVVVPIEAHAGKRITQMSTGAGSVHTNSTDETSVANKAFAAGELLPGKVYEFESICRATATNSSDTLAMRVRFGTSATASSNTAIATSTAVDQVTEDMSVIRGRIYVQSTTRYVFSVMMSDPDAEGEPVLAFHYIFTAVANTAYNLDITGDWSAASTDDDLQCEAFAVFEIT